ncbi:hypothetical protein [Microbulbifer variabilis]|uniref:hypothetical protein n=1 Tax=Microbulbifer variabilis TaxID=266805 RepID=UPI00035CEE3E|nr:hypothetical protein [Microbulbifer variabilis]
MGALTAARISASRQDISGRILQAPMVKFDQAVVNYARAAHPLASGLIPESNFREGATRALEKANIYHDNTRIKALLISSSTPTLLFLSPSDPIAPIANPRT